VPKLRSSTFRRNGVALLKPSLVHHAVMSWRVLGAGLLGSFLGAAGQAGWAGRRRPGRISESVLLPIGQVHWSPAAVAPASTPTLLAMRCHHAPWHNLPPLPLLAAQNGLGQPCPVLVCFFGVDRRPDGIIAATAAQPHLVIGQPIACWLAIVAAWRQAGLKVDVVEDIRPMQWEKAILNATVGPLCLATGRSMRAVWQDPELRDLVLCATSEGVLAAAASGVALPPGMTDRTRAFFDRMGDHRPSVISDPGEIPWVLGRILHAACEHHLPAPALNRINAMSILAHTRNA
jgi:hypothetical protein